MSVVLICLLDGPAKMLNKIPYPPQNSEVRDAFSHLKKRDAKEVEYLKKKFPYWFKKSWSKEKCLEDAKKYKTRTEWITKSGSAYATARLKGWLEECCKHMKRIQMPPGYWTLKKCKLEAKKYNTRKKWNINSSGSYQTARINKWLDICCSHMKKPSNLLYWTKKTCLKEAKKYKTRVEWSKKSCCSYKKARKNNWAEECCAHMELGCKPPNYWNNKKRCLKEAKKYKTRSEWAVKNSSSYAQAKKNGWLKDAHMKLVINPSGHWTKARCIKDAKRYKIYINWVNNSKSSYSAACRNNWLKECSSHMKKRKPGGYWTKERCIEDARKYKTRNEWYLSSKSAYCGACKNNWLKECCAHMKLTRMPKGYWNFKRCKKEALKYKSVTEWNRNSSSSYFSARKIGCVKVCSSHMIQKRNPFGYWTLEKCKKESKKYKNRTEWHKYHQYSLKIARENNWIKDCNYAG